jgi:DNA-binding HxlR family transcriptional regulator
VKKNRRSECPIAYALDLFGDRWTLLVLRDMTLLGKHYYGEFLEAGEGIATNILAERLDRLERAGLIVKEKDSEDAKRNRYTLTEKGLDVLPILLEMVAWGATHDPKTPVSAKLLHRIRTARDAILAEHRARIRRGCDPGSKHSRDDPGR